MSTDKHIESEKHPLQETNLMEPNSKEDSSPRSNLTLLWKRVLNRKGILFALLGGLASALQLVFVTLAESDGSVSAFQVLFVRSSMNLLCLPFISWQQSTTYRPLDMIFYFLAAFCGNIAGIFVYTALLYADIGNVSAVAFNLPTTTAILGYLLLGEKLPASSIVMFALNFLGIIFVGKPSFLRGEVTDSNQAEFFGMILAFFCLLCLSCSSVFLRKLAYREHNDPNLNVVITGFVGMGMAGICLSITNGWNIKADLIHWVYLLLLGTSSVFTVCFITYGTRTEVGNVSMSASFVAITMNFVLQVIVFKHMIDLLSSIGVTLIIVSTIGHYINLSRQDEA